MSEKAKALVAETVDQLNKLPDSKKDKAKQMMVAFAAGIAIGAELAGSPSGLCAFFIFRRHRLEW